MEQDTLRIGRNARRRRLGKAIGRCAAASPAGVLTSVHSLFAATTGDEGMDRAVRTTMLTALEESAESHPRGRGASFGYRGCPGPP